MQVNVKMIKFTKTVLLPYEQKKKIGVGFGNV
jgi:hypothetical protein